MNEAEHRRAFEDLPEKRHEDPIHGMMPPESTWEPPDGDVVLERVPDFEQGLNYADQLVHRVRTNVRWSVVSHSPDGFEFGYGGSGPADLSLNKSEASFASLCGVSPIEASSGKVVRHRLNRGGDRDANNALYLICVVRMRYEKRTRDYFARRTAEGKSKRELIRCLKRYIAREIYHLLVQITATSSPTVSRSEAR